MDSDEMSDLERMVKQMESEVEKLDLAGFEEGLQKMHGEIVELTAACKLSLGVDELNSSPIRTAILLIESHQKRAAEIREVVRIEERDYWEKMIRDDATRAGIDFPACVGMALVHLMVERIETLTAYHAFVTGGTLPEDVGRFFEVSKACERFRAEKPAEADPAPIPDVPGTGEPYYGGSGSPF